VLRDGVVFALFGLALLLLGVLLVGSGVLLLLGISQTDSLSVNISSVRRDSLSASSSALNVLFCAIRVDNSTLKASTTAALPLPSKRGSDARTEEDAPMTVAPSDLEGPLLS
jgi:hypothetical protein